MALYSNSEELAAKSDGGYQMVCPQCGSHKFRMPVTSAGVVEVNFGSGKPVIEKQQLTFGWSEEDDIACLVCPWEGPLRNAKVLDLEEVLARTLLFIERCEADGEDATFLAQLKLDVSQLLTDMRTPEEPLTPESA